MIYLDTHVVAWLYSGRVSLIPELAQSLINGNDLLISPMVGLELQYLHEIGRTGLPAARVLGSLEHEIGLEQCDLPFADVVERALGQDWTRDPFDRLIVSQADVRGAPLVTKDESIHAHYSEAVWG